MATYNVNELEGEALRLAVARAEGFRVEREDGEDSWCVWFPVGHHRHPCRSLTQHGWRPDVDWADGGPIIERESISVMRDAEGGYWVASTKFFFEGGIDGPSGSGPNPLIAAMRAFVCSRFGESIDLDA